MVAQIKQKLAIILVVAIIIIVAITLIIVGYRFNWTGFNETNKSSKTLWDWLQLLIIPIILVIGGFWLNQIQRGIEQRTTEQRDKTGREIALDNQREVALQAYIDKMSDLLFEKGLRESQPEDEVRIIARARTLTVLSGLDADRKGNLLQFLYEAHLINKDMRGGILNLEGADLNDINLCNVNLRQANLSKTNLRRARLSRTSLREIDLSYADLDHADLSYADLSHAYLRSTNLFSANLYEADLLRANLRNANLRHANLCNANLDEADLYNADLEAANLSDATVFTEQLNEAKSFQDATMPDGSNHP
jgi:uncharacterized protein YjbI with pentapeptide repeats